MKLLQLKNGYRYNTDTLMLYGFMLEFLKPFKSLLDVGAGCGVLGLLASRDKSLNSTLLDIQAQNIALCELNAKTNGLSVTTLCCDFSQFKSQARFDFIVSNPPFYKDDLAVSAKPHKAISKSSSSLSLLNFIKTANSHLTPQGELIFCYDPLSVGEIFALLSQFKLSPKTLRFIHPNANKPAGLVLVRAKKSAKPTAKVLAPLFVFDGNDISKEASQIYQKAGLISQDIDETLLLKKGQNG